MNQPPKDGTLREKAEKLFEEFHYYSCEDDEYESRVELMVTALQSCAAEAHRAAILDCIKVARQWVDIEDQVEITNVLSALANEKPIKDDNE